MMRHRFHALCPYFAMFPEAFVRKHLVWSKAGDVIFDPFSGRGTTVFESLLNDRDAIGCDLNPVAVCVSNAKADPPSEGDIKDRLVELRGLRTSRSNEFGNDDFFAHCFHPYTLEQLCHLRKHLRWKRNRTDRFIAALVLGSLHGESHRSERYLSNRMPRTISTKPDYSIRWWKERKLRAPKRDVYEILDTMVRYRFASEPAKRRGVVKQTDARRAIDAFPDYEGRVSMVITSPPYLDTTNFEEDQWLRLWFLGGPRRPDTTRRTDSRHTSEERYWDFLVEAWAGLAPLLKRHARIIVRIGGKKLDRNRIEFELQQSLEEGLEKRVSLLEARTTKIVGGQLRIFSPDASGIADEHDFHFMVDV